MKLLDRVGDVGLRRRLARSTIACYQSWIGEFLRFSRAGGRWRAPRELGAPDVEGFLTHLARDRRCSGSTQNQALCALVFLYKDALADELGDDHLGRFAAERARRPVRVPTVLSPAEMRAVLAALPPGSMHRRPAACHYPPSVPLIGHANSTERTQNPSPKRPARHAKAWSVAGDCSVSGGL